MCGIVGIADVKKLDVDQKSAYKQLLYADAVRGMHSTGTVQVTTGTKRPVFTFKKALEAADYLYQARWDKMEARDTRAFIGHNRHATMGAIQDRNAHPFTFGHISLVHNGTLIDYDELPRAKAFKVDSEAIAYAISVTPNPVDVLEKLNGAYSLVWYNQRDNTINFARNDERPMWLAKNALSTTMAWASERPMLEWILGRKMKNFKFTFERLPHEEYRSYKLDADDFDTYESAKFTDYNPWTGYNNTNYGWRSNRNNGRTNAVWTGNEYLVANNIGIGDTLQFVHDKYAPYIASGPNGVIYGTTTAGLPVVVQHATRNDLNLMGLYTGEVSGVRNAWSNSLTDLAITLTAVRKIDRKETIVVEEPAPEEDLIDDVSDNVMVSGPYGETTIKKFKEYCQDGCGCCSDPVLPHQAETIIWIGDSPVHADCYDTMLKD